MRLPWPFGRRTPSDGHSSQEPEDADGAPAVDPAPANPAGPAIAPATGAWATLPPIQRTVSATPLVAPSAPFLAGVPGNRPLPPIVEPLGHESGGAAPPGLVVAHVSTIPSLTSQAPMPTRQGQRRTELPAAAGDDLGTSHDVTGPLATVAASTPAAPGSVSGPGAATIVSAGAPIRQLATVAPGATITPPARPLTRSPEPIAVAQRSTGPSRVSSASAASSARPAAAPYTTTGRPTTLDGRPTPPPRGVGPARSSGRWAESSTAPLGTIPTPVGLGLPLGSGPGDHGPAGAGETATASHTAAVHPPLSAASRRAGLGAPIAVQPASAVAQPRPASGRALVPGPASEGPAATADRLPSASTSTSTDADAARHGAAAQSRPLPVLPVSRQRTGQPVPPSRVPAAPMASSASPAAAGVTPASSGTAFRPTMGIRPIQTGVAAQREAARAASATGDAPSVSARWASGDDLPTTVRSVAPSAEAPLAAELVPLVPLTNLSMTPASSGSPLTMSREVVFPPREGPTAVPQGTGSSVAGSPWIVGVQRQAADGQPSGLGASSSASPASPEVPGATATPSGTAPRGALTLARPQGAAPLAAASASTPVVSRTVGDQASGASRPAVQASIAGSGGGITATPVVQRVDGAAPAAPSDEGHSESELDELARALFGRIRTHLRAEVIHEREARGLTFDAF